MVEGLFNLLFYCESEIKQYAVPKTLTDVFGASIYYLSLVALLRVLWEDNIFIVKKFL